MPTTIVIVTRLEQRTYATVRPPAEWHLHFRHLKEESMHAHLYARETRTGESMSDQERIVVQYFVESLQPLGFEASCISCDEPTSKDTCFMDREAGAAIHRRVRSGDAVVMSSLPRGFDRLADFGTMLTHWAAMDVSFHAVLDGIDSSQTLTALDLARTINQLVTWREGRASERQRQVAAKQKEQGKPTNGSSPYGYRWTGRRGNRRLVRDEQEYQLMKQIVQWRDDDEMSVEDIYRRLRREGLKTRKGSEWSRSRISRAYFACKAEEGERSSAT